MALVSALACGKSPQSASTAMDANTQADANGAALEAGPSARDAADTGRDGATDGSTSGAGRICPDVKPATDAGKLAHPELSEASGLVESRVHPGLLWIHNDSGDSARLFAVSRQGEDRGVLTVKDADNSDWEDIAIGPGPKAGKSYLFIGDIGDNERKRDKVQIYRFGEPDVDAQGKLVETSVSADRITVEYADGPRDAETLLADPLTGDLYIVEKGFLGGGVYRIAAPGKGSSKVTATRVASVDLVLSTGGDVLPAGDGLAIRTYTGVSYWPRDPAKPLETAFESDPCALELGAETQGEALGFFGDGKGYLTVSEGAEAMLHAYEFAQSVSSKSR